METNKFDNLIHLRNKIEELKKESHIEIFKIFKKHNVDYSENKNGIFINLSTSNENVVRDVQEYLQYISKQEKIIDEIEDKKHSIEQSYFN